MQKPEESLDDFLKKVEPKVVPPPLPVSVRPTGEVEIVKPLARWERPAAVADEILARPAASRLSWFHRSLVFSGGVAVIAVVFLSAIFTAISDRSADSDMSSLDPSGYSSDARINDEPSTPAEDPAGPDILTGASSPPVSGKLRSLRPVAARPAARSKRFGVRVRRAAYRPRPRIHRPGPVVAGFVPTTLIIYPENGEIKTRIEPNFTAVYKKPLSFTK